MCMKRSSIEENFYNQLALVYLSIGLPHQVSTDDNNFDVWDILPQPVSFI